MMNTPHERLAFFLASIQGGGAERVMLNLARGVATAGYKVDLVLVRAEGPYMAQIPESVRVVDLKAPRALVSLPGIVRYLQQEKPVAFLSAASYINIVALWAWRLACVSTRMVVSEHSMASHAAQHTSSWCGRLMPQLRCFYRWSNGIVAVSKGVADDLAYMTGIPRKCIQVIYNPVVTPDLQRKMQVSLDHPWFKPGSPPVLLAVGRLCEVKDFPTLLQAFAQARRACPMRLIILGEGKERPVLEELVKRLGLERDVSLPGFVENPYAYMARASIFILSSKYEALPTVLVEALYCGLSIIATDCPGGTREILENGQYGHLVPVGDVEALANAIETVLHGPKTYPSQESWLPFELGTAVEQYLKILT